MEKEKVEKFFNRLWSKSVAKSISWFLTGIFLFLIMLLCMMPAQEIWLVTEDSPMLMPVVLTMLTYMMISIRILAYDQLTENQKSRYMVDILKYHPISKKEIWKQKMSTLILFLVKVTSVGLALQVVISLIAYKSVDWLNFLYIIFFVFVLPMAGVLTMDLFTKKVRDSH